MSMHAPNQFRVRDGDMGSDDAYGPNGYFIAPSVISSRRLAIIASDGRGDAQGWEHVSVHAFEVRGQRNYVPTWAEMCQVKDLFWDPEDLVLQFHPRRSEYVNVHNYTLHMWRLVNAEIPTPPLILV